MRLRIFAFQLGIGTLLAQLISLSFLPLITRIFTPNEYGKFTLIISITSMVLPLATLRIETSLLVDSTHERVKRESKVAVFSTLIVGAFISPIILIFLMSIKQLGFVESIEFSILFLITLIFQMLMVIMIHVNLMNGKYIKVAYSGVIQNFMIGLNQLLLSRLKPSGTLLTLGFILGKFFGLIPLLKTFTKIDHSAIVSRRSLFRQVKSKISENRFLISSSILEGALISLPIIASGLLYGIQFSGYIGLAQTVLTVPITLIAGSVGSVVLSEFSYFKKIGLPLEQSLTTAFLHFFKPLTGATIAFIVSVLFFGDEIFGFFLATEWNESIHLMKWLAVPFAINFMWIPFNNVLLAERAWRTLSMISSIRLLLSSTIAFVFFVTEFSWIVVAFSFFTAGSLVQLISMTLFINRGLSKTQH